MWTKSATESTYTIARTGKRPAVERRPNQTGNGLANTITGAEATTRRGGSGELLRGGSARSYFVDRRDRSEKKRRHDEAAPRSLLPLGANLENLAPSLAGAACEQQPRNE